MARPPTPDVRITEALQPAASIVNVGFTHPAPKGPSPLHGVAQALESLSGDLMAWGKKEQERQKEEDAIRGEAQFNKDYAEGIAEGIRTDQIPANSSREFVNGYKRASGASAGFQFSTAVENEYARSDIKTNPDPKAFDSWFREQTKKHVQTEDPSILRGLLPHLRQTQTTLYNRWQTDVAQNTKYEAISKYSALAGSTIDAYNREGLQNRTGTDLDTLGSTLDEIRNTGLKLGLKREEIDNGMVDAIVSKAVTLRDPQLLKLMDRGGVGGEKLSDAQYGRDKKAEAVKTLTSLFKQQTTEERLQQERDDKLASSAAKAKIADRLIKDPNAEVTDEDMAAIIKHDGNFKLDLLTWRKNAREGLTAEDPLKLQQVYEDLLKGGGEDTFWKAVTTGAIRSPESMARARSFMDIAAKSNASPSKILDTAAARSYVGNIEMLGLDSQFSEKSIMGIRALTPGGREALNNYRFGLMKWQQDNPQASPLEQEKYAAELGETIIKGLSAGTQGGDYTKPAAVQERVGNSPRELQPQSQAVPAPNTQPMPTPEAMPAAPQRAPAQQGQMPAWQRQMMESPAAPPKYEQMQFTPEERKQIEEYAASRKITPQDIINTGWEEGRKRLLGTGGGGAPAPTQQQLNPEQRSTGPRSSIDLPGGLGQIQLVGLNPDNLAMVQDAIRNLNLRPLIQQASLPANGGVTGESSDVLSSKRIAQINALPVGSIIERVAQRLGFDPDKAKVIASIESSGNPESGRGRPYKGLYQLNQDEWRRYGNGTDIHNAEANTEAGIKSMMDKSNRFKRDFGREPSAVELYLMHQQGEAGLRAHAANPDQPAWKSMLSTGEGQRKGEGWAKRAIWGNVPSDLRTKFNGVDDLSSREFIAVWTAKMLGISYEAALAQTRGGRARSV